METLTFTDEGFDPDMSPKADILTLHPNDFVGRLHSRWTNLEWKNKSRLMAEPERAFLR